MLAMLVAMGLGGVTVAVARELPHRLHEEPWPEGGVQVQVIVTYVITEAECRRLIAAYRGHARDGQVSVHRPVTSKKKGRAPWCVDNFDGRGVTFNTGFDWEQLPERRRR